MDENEKKVVATDLCARMPHGAINALYAPAYDSAHETRVDGLTFDELREFINPSNVWMKNITSIRPYLRPLTTMTDEEFEELKCRYIFIRTCFNKDDIINNFNLSKIELDDIEKLIEWLDRKMFDHRKIRKDGKLMTLIDAGLALPATEKMYKDR